MDDFSFYCMHSDLCKTIANPRRQQILGTLRDREMSVSELQAATGMTQSNLSQHLSILRTKGVLRARREGAFTYYSIAHPKIVAAFDLITEVMKDMLAERGQAMEGTPGE